jgi:hypothetical protein
MTRTPIAYIVFNRPQHTEKTFAVIREQRPSQLFLIADGPRQNFKTDIERCTKVREILMQIDWPCEVHRNYADSNLGLKRRVSSGLDWVFSKVERAIILEDDCLPNPDFFNFCDELLERYADNERVAVVTGNNFQDGQKRSDASYYFSKYNHCWGWATWRRSWQHYQENLPFWNEWRLSEAWFRLTPDRLERSYWNKIFEEVQAQRIDSWAYPWIGSVWFMGGLTATPNVNLVSNIGFGPESTHTASAESPLSNISTYKLGAITHPTLVQQNINADKYVFDNVFGGRLKRFPYILYFLPRWFFQNIFRVISGKLKI